MPRSHSRRAIRLLAFASLPFFLGGCFRHLVYVSPEGRRLEVTNFGFDSRIGRLVAETPQGRVEIEDAESQATAAIRLAELVAELARQARP